MPRPFLKAPGGHTLAASTLAAVAVAWLVVVVMLLMGNFSEEEGGPPPAGSPEKNVAHVFVQLTDPQLGMKNQYGADPTDWRDEADMFARLVNQTVQLQPKPSFILIGGDMQNFWPNEDGAGRNANANLPNLTMDGEDLGFHQRRDVREILAVATNQGIPVHYTPGNHDVGDEPNANGADTLKLYAETWGPLSGVVLHEGGILYLQLNSQLYWGASASLSAAKQEQNDWLEAELQRATAASKPKLVVLMTHIPPFMEDVGEEEGWANWRSRDREELLTLIARHRIPMLWVCGHFHGNVEKDGWFQGVPVHVRVSSAAGTTMQWDGQDSFTPPQAAAIAGKAVGDAFGEDIFSGSPANIAQRLQAIETRSGLRIFRTYTDGSFEDRWFTVKDLEGMGTHSLEVLLGAKSSSRR